MEIFGGAILLLIIYVIIQSKIKIDAQSFIMPTIPLHRGLFGVYCFTGHQGSGKTYSLNKFIRRQKGVKIYSNMDLQDLEYTPIRDIEHLYSLADESNIIIIYDEIFTLMSKSKKDRDMLEQFLPQMRKAQNIFLTTAQYWLELDITFRRFVRIQIECTTRPLGKLGGILFETYYDTTQIKWDNMENEYISPLITKKISKYEKRYMETYDTFQKVKALKSNIDKNQRAKAPVGGLPSPQNTPQLTKPQQLTPYKPTKQIKINVLP